MAQYLQPLDDHDITKPPATETKLDLAKLRIDIDEFKELAIRHCIKFMKTDASYAETKEIKQVVDIVNSIEANTFKSNQDSGTTINVLVQNLMQGISDDC